MWIKLFEKTKSLIKSSVSFDWKKCAWVFLLFVTVGFGIILPTEYASAWGPTDWLAEHLLNCVIAPIIGSISWIGILIAGFFVHLSSGILDAAMRPEIYNEILGKAFDVNSATNEPVGFINIAWTAVRDLVNMFFILILLLIAFGTVLRIEAYKAKNLLPKLIIAIFLVNFSKTISLIFVDFSQVFMYHLYNQIGSFKGSQRDLIGIVHDFALHYNPITGNIKVFSIAEAVGAFGACVFSFLLGFTYLALAAFMIIRLTMLCLVVVLSPAAFILLVLPYTKQYFSKWMDNLVKYSIIGPVFVFFIWLSGLMAFHLFHGATIPPVNISDVGGQELSGLSVAFENIVPFGVVIFILLYSMQAAKQLGIWGAAAVDKMTVAAGIAGGFAIGAWSKGKIKGGAIRGGKRTGRSTRRIADRATGGWLGRQKEESKKHWGGGVITELGAAGKKQQREDVEKSKNIYKGESDEVIRTDINRIGQSEEKVAAGLETLAGRKGGLKDEDEKLMIKAKYGDVDENLLYSRKPEFKAAGETDPAKRQAIIAKEMEKIHEEGAQNKIEAESLKNSEVIEAVQKEFSGKGEMERVFRNWGKKQTDAALEGLKKSFDGTFSAEDIAKRSAFAENSGKIKEAFETSPGMTTTAGSAAAKEYVIKLKAGDIGKVKEEDDLRTIGAYITKGQLTSVRGELSADQKKIIKQQIQTIRSGGIEEDYVNTSDAWAV